MSIISSDSLSKQPTFPPLPSPGGPCEDKQIIQFTLECIFFSLPNLSLWKSALTGGPGFPNPGRPGSPGFPGSPANPSGPTEPGVPWKTNPAQVLSNPNWAAWMWQTGWWQKAQELRQTNLLSLGADDADGPFLTLGNGDRQERRVTSSACSEGE